MKDCFTLVYGEGEANILEDALWHWMGVLVKEKELPDIGMLKDIIQRVQARKFH